MSVISNVHSFVKLDKDSKPAMGQRLVRLIAKGANKSPNLSESLAVSIPRITQDDVADVIDRLLPHVVGLIQDAQDKMIREIRIESGRDEIHQDQISMGECIAWLDATAAGDRVSSEYLTEWFAEEYQAAAIGYIADAMKVDVINGEVPLVVMQKYNVLREMFAGWSSPKYSPNIPKLKAMIRFAESVSELDGRMSGLLVKAKAMLVKKESEMTEDALGF
jgi:hypothetical protein